MKRQAAAKLGNVNRRVRPILEGVIVHAVRPETRLDKPGGWFSEKMIVASSPAEAWGPGLGLVCEEAALTLPVVVDPASIAVGRL
jgi:hypothetical protein